jgi:hypothetical protein
MIVVSEEVFTRLRFLVRWRYPQIVLRSRLRTGAGESGLHGESKKVNEGSRPPGLLASKSPRTKDDDEGEEDSGWR